MRHTSILVTGGAGFIGSNFVRFLLETEPELQIVNLDALTYAGNLASLGEDVLNSPRHHFVRGDIANIELVRYLASLYNFTGIINFAAESHVDRSITGPQIFIDTNVNGTMALLTVAREIDRCRFLQISTDEVYGSLGSDGFFCETTPLAPSSPYSASKASADLLVQAFYHTFALDGVITRCSNNYGPYQFPEKMIPLMIYNALNDKQLPVYGDGMNVRDWLHVLDHCAALWQVFQHGSSGQVYNIGGNNEQTNLDVVRAILMHLNKPETLIRFVTDRPGHDRRYAIDARKVRQDLGWAPSMGFGDGISQTINWYLQNHAWLQQIVSGDYQNYYQQMYSNR